MNSSRAGECRPGPVNIDDLDRQLSDPTPGAIETMARLEGDIIVLGVAGKMGPTLARMAKRASEAAGVSRRVIGVARFSDSGEQARLESHGVETIRCDLLDEALVAGLPDVPNVIFMAGMKFGATAQEWKTWAMNTYLPAVVAKKFASSRIVAFSTGNVYGLVPADCGGSRESDALAPVGEYAMSCVGRERMFEYFSRIQRTGVAIIRLNYACELRYGVLVDIARRVFAGESVDVTMGWFNVIWQGDANAMALETFAHVAVPPWVVNVTGPERLSVRDVAMRFAELFGRDAHFAGAEQCGALLSNAEQAFDRFGTPRVMAEELMTWIADWVRRGGAHLGKPTHFEVRDGRF